ncbi:hypothetical protein M2272_005905 [Mycobacterium frederiksbergense]|uniref:Uncharacterized protein n=1 Tax=Mycolicibacterium frederiksbergense TaxID=117567 RepID=A0ABT6L8F1_9MYCO|nr:hypothetical protein [Mycolicibacterium frederiksbergense]MDH6199237.1 hypothetical protein [Mycolicibacterium frederiksbergense]
MSLQLCPACGRHVTAESGRFTVHSATGAKGETCHLSRERTPITGTTERDYERRADLIGHLAWRLKDEDPRKVRDYLTAMPAVELQRMLMLALAAVPVDRSIDEVFGWVCDLPEARLVAVA